jgi:hypothetical protein
MRRIAAVLAGTPLLLATTCLPNYDLKTSPSPQGDPQFHARWKGAPVALRTLTVQRCRPGELRHVVWAISGHGDGSEPITYGQVPEGYTEQAPAEPLVPGGCYETLSTGYPENPKAHGMWGMDNGSFHVRADGRVMPGHGPRGTGEHQFTRAAVGCRRALRHARTAADTAAIDARAWPVADTSVTCQAMRTDFAQSMREATSTEKMAAAIAALAGVVAGAIWLDGVLNRTLPKP